MEGVFDVFMCASDVLPLKKILDPPQKLGRLNPSPGSGFGIDYSEVRLELLSKQTLANPIP